MFVPSQSLPLSVSLIESYLYDCLLQSKSDSWPVKIFFSRSFSPSVLSHCFIGLYLIHFSSTVVSRNFCAVCWCFFSVSFAFSISFWMYLCMCRILFESHIFKHCLWQLWIWDPTYLLFYWKLSNGPKSEMIPFWLLNSWNIKLHCKSSSQLLRWFEIPTASNQCILV